MTQHHDDGHHEHGHGHVHLGEADWAAMAERTERAGEVLIGFVTDTAAWLDELRGSDAPAVQRVLDVGSGPGVAACEFARHYPQAAVTAIDSSPAMLQRAQRRAERSGLGDRVTTRQIELPDGLDELAGAFDVVWASMSLHHVGDEVAALRALGATLAPSGLLAVAEFADPMRVLTRRPRADRRRGWPSASTKPGGAGSRRCAVGSPARSPPTIWRRWSPPPVWRSSAPASTGCSSPPRSTTPPAASSSTPSAGSVDRSATSSTAPTATRSTSCSTPTTPPGSPVANDVFLEASQQIVIARRATT